MAKTNTNNDDMVRDREFIEDIFEVEDTGEMLEQDLEEDLYKPLPLVPDGKYKVLCFLAREGAIEAIRDEDGELKHVRVNIVCRIQEGEYEGVDVYANVSTMISRGRKISSMAYLLRKMKVKFDANIGSIALAKKFVSALDKKIPIGIETTWVCRTTPNEDNIYGSVVKKGMKNFPKDEEGNYVHVITDKKTGEELVAKVKVVRFMSIAEMIDLVENEEIEEEEIEGEMSKVTSKKTTSVSVKGKKTKDEEDEEEEDEEGEEEGVEEEEEVAKVTKPVKESKQTSFGFQDTKQRVDTQKTAGKKRVVKVVEGDDIDI